MRIRHLILSGAMVAAPLMLAPPAQAEEGMWTFDNFPTAKMQGEYGWAPDQQWLDRTRAAAVRLTGGCSASFVSPEGLILTNHHCVVDCLQNLSTASRDLVDNGFNPSGRQEELMCPGQQAEVVTQITDVTNQVKQAIGTLSGEALIDARNAIISQLESTGCEDGNIRCQVVSLFGGGQYKLYRYRKYSDVRLAWAPEFQAAFFGGDPDNFNYPRYALDASFLRAYDNGRPAATPDHLRWNPRAPQPGEITFVVGNPGSTSRLYTQAQVDFDRDVRLPVAIATMSELRGRLIALGETDAEKAREAKDTLFGLENRLKVFLARQRALNDAAFTGRLDAGEQDLRQRSAADSANDPWTEIDQSMRAYRDLYLPYEFIEPSGELYGYAQTLVRAAEERSQPNAQRLPGYTDSALPLLEKNLLDQKPIHPWLEKEQLSWSLAKAREYLGTDDADTKLLLGRESPEALADRLVSGTRLADPAYRRSLWQGGLEAIRASDDPMIRYALRLDQRQRDLRKQINQRVEGPVAAAQTRLSDARFAAYGDTIYPDATFTLRISYGQVRGWQERGRTLDPVTTIGGAFERATGSEPYNLAAAFLSNERTIDKSTVYDFVSTNDIIGGNSGSPVIARDGSVIGAAFDGNIHSIGGNYGYDPELNRTVSVSAAAIQEALTKIYPAPRLVRELAQR
ncbi:S46 family peptidase [Croceicoccus sp. F390]|uniref:Dipeptidyl-peptidase n=1 Tax=Croceicoccus esteveae TaxID=3075597 RepID=A0ABU2ZE13_9SPHN|nr:S46 family peptidase [Croceicoccus sp. F390]MDT0574841.1 S46 family peptidase [Croceicoccus sp. F390]